MLSGYKILSRVSKFKIVLLTITQKPQLVPESHHTPHLLLWNIANCGMILISCLSSQSSRRTRESPPRGHIPLRTPTPAPVWRLLLLWRGQTYYKLHYMDTNLLVDVGLRTVLQCLQWLQVLSDWWETAERSSKTEQEEEEDSHCSLSTHSSATLQTLTPLQVVGTRLDPLSTQPALVCSKRSLAPAVRARGPGEVRQSSSTPPGPTTSPGNNTLFNGTVAT